LGCWYHIDHCHDSGFVYEALKASMSRTEITLVQGCQLEEDDNGDFDEVLAEAEADDAVVMVLGRRAAKPIRGSI
jgi:hypothetical protein